MNILIMLGTVIGILLFLIIISIINGTEGIAEVAGIFFIMFGVIFVIVFSFWLIAESKVKWINKTYGTDYTQEEIFYFGSTIERTLLDIKDSKIHVDIEGLMERDRIDE